MTKTSDNGLPQNSVKGIVRTRDGYLWFGTFEGLTRFDGVDFKVFDIGNTPEFKSNYVQALLEDRQGNLWIGIDGIGLQPDRQRGNCRRIYGRKSKSDGNRRVTYTGNLGVYTFSDLPVGQTYAVTVKSRRFSFDDPTYIVQLHDHLFDLDFAADPQE